jgi:hypothetical protein
MGYERSGSAAVVATARPVTCEEIKYFCSLQEKRTRRGQSTITCDCHSDTHEYICSVQHTDVCPFHLCQRLKQASIYCLVTTKGTL